MPLEMVVHTLDSLDFNVERKELYADREIEIERERERGRDSEGLIRLIGGEQATEGTRWCQ